MEKREGNEEERERADSLGEVETGKLRYKHENIQVESHLE